MTIVHYRRIRDQWYMKVIHNAIEVYGTKHAHGKYKTLTMRETPAWGARPSHWRKVSQTFLPAKVCTGLYIATALIELHEEPGSVYFYSVIDKVDRVNYGRKTTTYFLQYVSDKPEYINLLDFTLNET